MHLHQISSGSNSTAADGDQNALIEAEVSRLLFMLCSVSFRIKGCPEIIISLLKDHPKILISLIYNTKAPFTLASWLRLNRFGMRFNRVYT